MDTPSIGIFTQICNLLDARGIEYSVKLHEPTFTSKESAAARGDDLSVGGKALVLKLDDRFAVFVIPADRKLASKAIKQALRVRNLRFATPEELMNQTGLVPGSVPPFGRPLFEMDLYVDSAVYLNEQISFNAGDLCKSITLRSQDHRIVASPTLVAQFAES